MAEVCIYCGQPVGRVRKGEHVVPAALAAKATIRRVCGGCNNNVLSQLDQELVSRSPLSNVASSVLDTVGDNIWGYDAYLDLALEGRLERKVDAVVLWPQVVIDGKKVIFCYDAGEMSKVGLENGHRQFHRLLLEAISTVRREYKKPRLRWCPSPNLPKRGRFPPRIFTKHACNELRGKISFECRYHGKIERNRILRTLERWKPDPQNWKQFEREGVDDPEAMTIYRPRWILRALVKIGINLLAYVMGDEFSRDRFLEAVEYVRFDRGCGPSEAHCGFLQHAATEKLACPPDSHKFVLQYDRNWGLYCSFFGGMIGAWVYFPGTCWGEARCINVVAPIGLNQWQVNTSPILVPTDRRVTIRPDLMAPSLQIKNVQTRIRIVDNRTRRKEASGRNG